ncbi:MAG: ATP-binding cassette domain-containing protein [Faecalibacillus sp.]
MKKIESQGEIQVGLQLLISYVNQSSEELSGSIKDYAKTNEINESVLKTILRKMGFERSQFDKNIEDFSMGQKKKLMLSRSLCQKAHLYIWDEPFNYLDIYSRRQIEKVIKEYQSTMLFNEHDRFFCDEKDTDKLVMKKC